MSLLGYEGERWSQGVNYLEGELGPYVCLVQAPSEHLDAGYHRRRVGLNHLAFRAKSRAQVDEVRNWAREAGHVFCEDPDRIKLEVVAPSEP